MRIHQGRPRYKTAGALGLACAGLLVLTQCHGPPSGPDPAARLSDSADGTDWGAYGRSLGAQHFSPLGDIATGNIAQLKLAWHHDLPFGNSATEPIVVDGVMYAATGLSIVHAIDAATGRELWVHDPHAAERAGINLRLGWGVRGLAWWDGKLFVGTQDGRLIALDAKTGDEAWSVQTYPKDYAAFISGAPRVVPTSTGAMVIIGYGGSTGVSRGYVTAYDAKDGHQLWRFYTVPGDPAHPENPAMAMAAKTWFGDWRQYGGGGDVWNAIAYDPETHSVIFGVGSPYPWNHRLRSASRGDNLFIDAIVAVDARTGAYKWHYQTVPGDTWDFDATMDIELADLTIAGVKRKVLMQAPKDGFFYVIDRVSGKLISAEPFVPVTWASRVDPTTGRPVEMPGARFPVGTTPKLSPTPLAAHNWPPMAFSPQTGLTYIPAVHFAASFSDASKGWKPSTERISDGAVNMVGGEGAATGPLATHASGELLAWDPARQQAAWRVSQPTYVNGGVLATGGGLVFQGTVDGFLSAYDARSGKLVWRYDGKAPIMAPPIAFRAGGKEYVTVLTGLGMAYAGNAAAIQGPAINRYAIDPRSQARRVLTFAIDGADSLPPSPKPAPVPADADFKPEPARMMPGAIAYAGHCATCHGALAVGINYAPDLRRSPVPPSADAFRAVVHDGALVSQGMPKFADLPDQTREDIRSYLRTRMAALRSGGN